MDSRLLTVQKIDAIKTFLLPSLDFLMLNGEIGRGQLSKIDKKIRGAIDSELGIRGLPIDCHHASWRDGGLSYPSLVERSEVLTIRSFIQMVLSEHEEIKRTMRQFIEDERKFRRIEIEEASQFLNWSEEHGRSGTSTIVEKTRRSCRNLEVEMKLRGEEVMLKNKGSECITRTAAGIGHFLTQKIVRPRRQNNLTKYQVHGAAYVTLEDNVNSNKILRDIFTTRSDAFFRFVVAGRADCLPTPANVQRWFNKERSNCEICEEGRRPTFAHILNECRVNFVGMTKRHNKLSDVIRRAIEMHNGEALRSPIEENTQIREEGLSAEVENLRPDLVFTHEINGQKVTEIIEISCPYGYMSHGENTLQRTFTQKEEKYRRLAAEVEQLRQHKARVTPIIVSSMGAIFKESAQRLHSILRCVK
jgi:hypothetical protein